MEGRGEEREMVKGRDRRVEDIEQTEEADTKEKET